MKDVNTPHVAVHGSVTLLEPRGTCRGCSKQEKGTCYFKRVSKLEPWPRRTFLTKAWLMLEQAHQCQIMHAAVRYDPRLQACGVLEPTSALQLVISICTKRLCLICKEYCAKPTHIVIAQRCPERSWQEYRISTPSVHSAKAIALVSSRNGRVLCIASLMLLWAP